ncbi:NAD-dependent epimerase/dehydratase family protein [Amnibacterium setariae]|uniref:NAD-dependent epimerase/dehydratase family protein n=1 Tax=Amnibacterium setariae TaxID=2306585 RepID=A0A3A1UBX9_9MICO|nr:NAD-dependent epimerase/dehydratase family protein [Amnibacterium setariae]RIX30766.1 NAD-dependent epimerase/dehydratase family protein [Amnibacterium setariae]
MLEQDEAALTVLYIGGTGTISASCVRLSVESGMRVAVLNRGNNTKQRDLPDDVEWITADVTDEAALAAALEGRSFDAIVNFLSYDRDDAERAVRVLGPLTRQYVYISSASVYGKPVLQTPVTESTPTHNRFLAYARAKLRAERVLQDAYAEHGFPMTIVRPSHTYDDANPPLPGDWTVVDRIANGDEIPVHGDGTSLWTLTHAEDFAVGLVGLLGNPRAIGEVFHITGDDVWTWDQIYTTIAEALGVPAKLVHVPSELYPVVAPDWFWSELLVGDLAHSAVFDNTKIKRFVPAFGQRLTFHRAVRRMLAWRAEHPELTGRDATTDAVLERIVAAYHAGRAAFAEHAPATVDA